MATTVRTSPSSRKATDPTKVVAKPPKAQPTPMPEAKKVVKKVAATKAKSPAKKVAKATKPAAKKAAKRPVLLKPKRVVMQAATVSPEEPPKPKEIEKVPRGKKVREGHFRIQKNAEGVAQLVWIETTVIRKTAKH